MQFFETLDLKNPLILVDLKIIIVRKIRIKKSIVSHDRSQKLHCLKFVSMGLTRNTGFP